MYPGILFDGHQITRAVFPIYNAAHDAYDIMQDARWAWYNDAGTMRRWARKVPPPGSAGLIITSYPTDGDPNFRYTVAGRDATGTYTQTINIAITRRSTGSPPLVSGAGYWQSDGGQEIYDVAVDVTNTLDNTIPSEFSSVQIASDTVYSAAESYQDPRAAT